MSTRNLYALTPDEAKRLVQYARDKGTTAANYAADALIPIEMDAAVERIAVLLCATGDNRRIWERYLDSDERESFRKDARTIVNVILAQEES